MQGRNNQEHHSKNLAGTTAAAYRATCLKTDAYIIEEFPPKEEEQRVLSHDFII
jgi:hypothetical protein